MKRTIFIFIIIIIILYFQYPYINYENNDFDSYTRSIAKTIKSFENEVDVIFLAQASMEGAKDHLQNFKVAVLSSPEFGVREYVKML